MRNWALLLQMLSATVGMAQLNLSGDELKLIDLYVLNDGLVVSTSQNITDTTYFQRHYLLNDELEVLNSVEIYFEEIVGANDQAHGKLHMKDGEIWLNGIANKVRDISAPLGANDSCFFYTLRFTEDLELIAWETEYLMMGWHYSEGEQVDETGMTFVAYDGLGTYSLCRKNWGEAVQLANPFFVPNGFFMVNPGRQFITFSGPGFHAVRAHTEILHFYDEQLQLDSIVDLWPQSIASHWLGLVASSSIVDLGESYFSFSATSILGPYNIEEETPFILRMDKHNRFIDEFFFENPDSTIEGSYYESLSMNGEGDLMIGMHIRAEDEPYANHLKVIKSDTLGNLMWQKVIGEGGDLRYVFRKLITIEDGGAIICAERFSDPSSMEQDGLILYRLNEWGEVTGDMEISQDNRIGVYPNPFSTSFMVTGVSPGTVYRLSDLQGRLLDTGVIAQEWVSPKDGGEGLYLLQLGLEKPVTIKIMKD